MALETRTFQVTFDAHDPRALSTFWRDVLGYVHPGLPGVEVPEGSDRLDAVTFTEVAAQAGPGPGQEAGRKIGARVFDKARRYWQGRL